ncbi:hypothetical protein DID88_009229 [Monilinia fructigena]|uniref:Xylanolytic transcriptional activator regulatory domain-containing protein n=1 Tax=Monilinia fructigena TaxID=38457 RepID=A0A395IHM9_9HELO|nr:hypothetical protein DID88_009229 [Monilinia fructigena]
MDSLAEVWRKSQLLKELERLLPILEPGPGSGSTEISKRKRLDSDVQIGKRPVLGNVPTWPDQKIEFQIPEEVPASPLTTGRSMGNFASTLQDYNAHHGSVLSAAYPKTEKHDLLRISYQYSQIGNSGTDIITGDHALLWAAIAYAKFQHRAINNIPHAQGLTSRDVWTAERMYTHARALVPNEEGILDLGHVQALLILTLANLGLAHFNRAWILVGQAVRIAIELGLDKPLAEDPNSSKQSSRSRHVFLGCFALDTLVAARLKRRPHLKSDDIDRVGMLVEDGLEEWDPWTDCLTVRRNAAGSSRVPASILSTFNRLIQFTFLKRHSNTFGLLIVPPTFEYYTKTAYGVFHAVRRSIENTHIVLDDWKYNLDMCASTMEPAWPVFESFKNRAENVLARNRRESQAAFDFMVPTATNMPQVAKTPNSTASYELSQPYSPQIFRSQSMNSMDVARPNRKNLQYAKNFVPPTSHSNQSFNGSIVENFAARIPESPNSVYNSGNNAILTPWGVQQQNQNPNRTPHQIPFGLLQQSPNLQRAIPASSVDTDRQNSMEQSLVNLGFEDPDKRNQDFYTFCREPDPLYSNNSSIFQQLLASSAADSSGMGAQIFGNAGMSMPGEAGFGEGVEFRHGDEGIEAGQILQALSAAEEQRNEPWWEWLIIYGLGKDE